MMASMNRGVGAGAVHVVAQDQTAGADRRGCIRPSDRRPTGPRRPHRQQYSRLRGRHPESSRSNTPRLSVPRAHPLRRMGQSRAPETVNAQETLNSRQMSNRRHCGRCLSQRGNGLAGHDREVYSDDQERITVFSWCVGVIVIMQSLTLARKRRWARMAECQLSETVDDA